ncbi:coproporphyrinogen-III oxidase family protein [Olsenella profusa]|uniref:Heme chaperone HemW n=1 Tax=Olsenella profusa TaxID=138595 RepID=A0ABS2F2M6_9ACTN|nr:coproporphyrinogen-III oxidase family protein [Olsenella profusa]MBM6775251.1 coproporphyrinogen III oxidase family protein [Olsenella profusa]
MCAREARGAAAPGVGALYLHIPFCARKCAYCDFASRAARPGDPLVAAYVRALEAQLEEAASLGLLEGCETAYVGGGTPSLLGPSLLGGLVERVVRTCAPGELSSEANPDSLTDEVIDALRRAGATRLSVGVQSLDDAELACLGRLHDAASARERVRAAVASGLDVSVDLMCATPGQTDASWARTLAGAVALGVGHVSVYPLQIEEGTEFDRRYADDPCAFNDPDVQANRMTQAQAVLEGHGLARYEVASYARPGRECRHNIAYWTGVPYLGLGTKASSMLDVKLYLRLCGAVPGLPEPPAGTARVRLTVESGARAIAGDPRLSALSLSTEFLGAREAAAEDLMLAMRMTRGAGPGLLGRAREAIPAERLEGALREAVDTGLAAWSAGRLVPTQRGWLLGNELYGLMWDLAGTC